VKEYYSRTIENVMRNSKRLVVAGLAFILMEHGIKQFAAQNGIDASMTGSADADPRKQADIIRKLIAEKPNAITVEKRAPSPLRLGPRGAHREAPSRRELRRLAFRSIFGALAPPCRFLRAPIDV
jgi:hypothetical protein